MKFLDNLNSQIDIYNYNFIKNNIPTKHSLEIFDSIDSTNNYIKRNFSKLPFNHIVISNERTSGRGRNSKKFTSPKNTGIYMSVFLKPTSSLKESFSLPIFTSVAIFLTIKELYSIDVSLKWVNDIMINDLKMGGILCESELTDDCKELKYIIIGIGLNIHKNIFDNLLINIATSVENHSDRYISRNIIISSLINNFEKLKNNKELVFDIYKKHSYILGKEITVIQNNESYIAKAIDISDEGYLIVKKDNETIILSSAEISTRIY